MKPTAWRKMFAFVVAILMTMTLLPTAARAESAATVAKNALQISEVTYTYATEGLGVDRNPGAVGEIRFRATITGPANVVNGAVVSRSAAIPTEKKIYSMIESALPRIKASNWEPERLPVDAYENLPVRSEDLGKTLYVLFLGIDGDCNTVGYGIAAVKAGESGTAVLVQPAAEQPAEEEKPTAESPAAETPAAETPAPASSSEIVGSGQMGDNVYWTLSADGVLTVSGKGPTWNYEDLYTNHDWYWVSVDNKSVKIKSIEIGDGITSLGDCLFAELKELTNVKIPDSVTNIGSNTFRGCSSLTELKLPSNLKSIGNFAFKNCSRLTEIKIPDSVTEIGLCAFNYCKSVTSVSFPDRLRTIEGGVLWNCVGLKKVDIPVSITKIGEFAFAGCNSLCDVYYAGAEVQWRKIQIDYSVDPLSGSSNAILSSVNIHYNASTTTDEPSAWAKTEVQSAVAAGLVPASLQQNYMGPVSRGEVAQMFINLVEKSSGKDVDVFMSEKGVNANTSAFSDTSDKAVLAANALGIINGVGSGKFDPNGTLTRAQIAAIINRAARTLGVDTSGYTHSFTDVQGHWAGAELGWPVSAGIINGVGDNKFDPDAKLTTEQAVAITYRALNALKK